MSRLEALRVDRLYKHFGGLAAVNGVSLSVRKGERRAIIGPNGAGKTTLFNLISGWIPVSSGKVFIDGEDVTPLSIHERSGRGLARTFQKNNLFLGLSVFENVRLAVQRKYGISSNFLTDVSKYRGLNQETEAVLDRFNLGSRARMEVRNLSYGEQRQLEVAIALATGARILLLDEPTAGMSPAETASMTEMIAGLPRDLTILIIEHDMDVVFSLAERVTVLHYGEVLAEGLPADVKANPKVTEVYLGA